MVLFLSKYVQRSMLNSRKISFTMIMSSQNLPQQFIIDKNTYKIDLHKSLNSEYILSRIIAFLLVLQKLMICLSTYCLKIDFKIGNIYYIFYTTIQETNIIICLKTIVEIVNNNIYSILFLYKEALRSFVKKNKMNFYLILLYVQFSRQCQSDVADMSSYNARDRQFASLFKSRWGSSISLFSFD